MAFANELFQWAFIAAFGFLTIGLLRQLGYYLEVDERRAPDGIRIGQDVPLRAVSANVRATLARRAELVPSTLLQAVVVLGTDEESAVVVEQLIAVTHHLPMVVIARGIDDETIKTSGWAGLADSVVPDINGELSSALRVGSAPFLFLVDSHFTVRFKVTSPQVSKNIRSWIEVPGEEKDPKLLSREAAHQLRPSEEIRDVSLVP